VILDMFPSPQSRNWSAPFCSKCIFVVSKNTKNAIFGENFSYLVFMQKKIQIKKNFFFKNIFDMPTMSKSKKICICTKINVKIRVLKSQFCTFYQIFGHHFSDKLPFKNNLIRKLFSSWLPKSK
jgi:hypothetical protein